MSEGFIILRAVDFAAKYHANQRRKCPEATPYINHCIAVARLVASSQRAWPTVVAAAVLHDVVEDTPATLQDVENAFGPEIAAMVAQVSDDKSLSKLERKQKRLEPCTASQEVRLIKLADKYDNLCSLTISPPVGWSEERIRGYAAWAWHECQFYMEADPSLALLTFQKIKELGVTKDNAKEELDKYYELLKSL